MELKEIKAFELKREEGKTYIEGYAAVYGNVDSYSDIITKGAFDKFLSDAQKKSRVRFCAQHDRADVLGVIEEIKSDEHGLFIRARISNTTLGKDYATLIEDGAVNEMSIGYKTINREYRDDGVRVLTEVELIEVSIVTVAANPLAKVTTIEKKEETSAKKLEEMNTQELQIEFEKAEAKYKEVSREINKRIINSITL